MCTLPLLLEDHSQLLFWIMDIDRTLLQVRLNQGQTLVKQRWQVIAVRRHIINGCFQTLFLNMVHLLAHLQCVDSTIIIMHQTNMKCDSCLLRNDKTMRTVITTTSDHANVTQVRVMLCDKAGMPVPPSQCRMLRAWVGAWFAPGRQVVLVEPAMRQLPSTISSAADRKADIISRLEPASMVTKYGQTQRIEDALCWDLLEKHEVVLDGGLQQVRACACVVRVRPGACVRACVCMCA